MSNGSCGKSAHLRLEAAIVVHVVHGQAHAVGHAIACTTPSAPPSPAPSPKAPGPAVREPPAEGLQQLAYVVCPLARSPQPRGLLCGRIGIGLGRGLGVGGRAGYDAPAAAVPAVEPGQGAAVAGTGHRRLAQRTWGRETERFTTSVQPAWVTRTRLWSYLGRLQQGDDAMAHGLLVLVPHEPTHATHSILGQLAN